MVENGKRIKELEKAIKEDVVPKIQSLSENIWIGTFLDRFSA